MKSFFFPQLCTLDSLSVASFTMPCYMVQTIWLWNFVISTYIAPWPITLYTSYVLDILNSSITHTAFGKIQRTILIKFSFLLFFSCEEKTHCLKSLLRFISVLLFGKRLKVQINCSFKRRSDMTNVIFQISKFSSVFRLLDQMTIIHVLIKF